MRKDRLGGCSPGVHDELRVFDEIEYGELEAQGTARVAIAQRLFGVSATPTLLPQLDEIAKQVRPE